MFELRPNQERAQRAIMLIWIVFALELLNIFSDIAQLNLLQTVANGGLITEEEANMNDLRVSILAVLYLIAYIISGITFIQWFRRAYYNLHQRVDHLSMSEGWAAGSWFVPIVNLFRPFQIMKELYVETANLLRKENIQYNESLNSLGILGLWWTLWILGNILGQISFRMPAETVDELILSTTINIISGGVGIALALITVKIIKNYAENEHLLLQTEEVRI